MQNATPRPRHPFYSDMSLILSQGFNDVLKGEESPEATADYMQAELQRIADVGKEVFNLAAEEGSGT
jgi:maltose-binding protein MalE